MKRKVNGGILLGLGILCLVSCDEGRIYEAVPATAEGGRTVKFTGKVTGMDTWYGEVHRKGNGYGYLAFRIYGSRGRF